MVSMARQLSSEVMLNLKDKPNYTGLEAQDRYYHGYLGEQVFLLVLRDNGKNGIYSVRTDGESDDCEFELETDMGVRTIDIKTASQSFHNNILVSPKQMEVHKVNFYVGVKLNGEFGEVWGYCMANDFVLNESGVDYRHLPVWQKNLKELRDINQLLNVIKPGEVIIKKLGIVI